MREKPKIVYVRGNDASGVSCIEKMLKAGLGFNAVFLVNTKSPISKAFLQMASELSLRVIMHYDRDSTKGERFLLSKCQYVIDVDAEPSQIYLQYKHVTRLQLPAN